MSTEVDDQFLDDKCQTKARLYEICTEKLDLYLPEYPLCSIEWLKALVQAPPQRLVRLQSDH